MAKKEAKKSGRGSHLGKLKYVLSPELSAVMGCKKASRPEIMKGLWKYIKANKLQDPNDKRTIIFDKKFVAIFGEKKCDMFYLAKGITNHISREK